MRIAELEQRFYAHTSLSEYVQQQFDVERIGSNTVRVNPCPICGHRDHFSIKEDANYWNVHNATCSGDMEGKSGGGIYKYLLYVEQLSPGAAYKKLHELAGVEFESNEPEDDFDIIEAEKNDPLQEATSHSDDQFIKSIPSLYQKQSKEGRAYFLNERGLPSQIVDKYQLFVYQKNGDKRAVMPIYENGEIVSYVERLITGKKQYLNRKGPVHLFNIELLKAENDKPVVVTESVIDALTLEARGIQAIGLNGVSNLDKFKDAVHKYNAKDKLIITAFDNDKTGKQTADKINAPILEIPKEYKDINEWSTAEIEAYKAGKPIASMTDSLTAQVENVRQPDNLAHYLDTQFNTDIEFLRSYKDKRTGFDNLDDEIKGVYPGLNVVGAITGGGKTTFVLQLADQMAKSGEHVLFFSLEQSKLELTSKSLARTTAENNLNDAVPSIQIRSGWQTASVKQSLEDYKVTAGRMNVIEGNFNTNAETVRKTVERYIRLNEVTPVVIVDYIQIMPAIDDSMNDKQRLDANVRLLKQMSRDLNITVFAISSLNRGNYMAPIDFESFKELGGIEYTADMIWGLQLEVIHSDLFNKQYKVKEKRAAISKAMKDTPRNIELVCLKNRNGNARFSCSFSYWAKYDYFEENVNSAAYTLNLEDDESPFDFKEEPKTKKRDYSAEQHIDPVTHEVTLKKPSHKDADIFDNADMFEELKN